MAPEFQDFKNKMPTKAKHKVLRPSGNSTMFLMGLSLTFLLLAIWRILADSTWFAGFFILLGLINSGLTIQHIAAKIVLFSDRIEFTTNYGKRSIPKEKIESVTWERGCGVSLRTKEKEWIHIPDLGKAQAVCNSVRAWLKRAG